MHSVGVISLRKLDTMVMHRIDSNAFLGVTTEAYYPGNKASWDKDTLASYGGTITWIPFDGGDGEENQEIVIVKFETGDGSSIPSQNIIEGGKLLISTKNIRISDREIEIKRGDRPRGMSEH